jgi:hypothetical protein
MEVELTWVAFLGGLLLACDWRHSGPISTVWQALVVDQLWTAVHRVGARPFIGRLVNNTFTLVGVAATYWVVSLSLIAELENPLNPQSNLYETWALAQFALMVGVVTALVNCFEPSIARLISHLLPIVVFLVLYGILQSPHISTGIFTVTVVPYIGAILQDIIVNEPIKYIRDIRNARRGNTALEKAKQLLRGTANGPQG